MNVVVIDMQPITPAVGGGRQRLLGLYHALGRDVECTYVGTYDWPGERYRDQQITPGLREIVVPLSSEHHAAAALLSQQMGGRTVIDIAFPDQVHLSPDFLRVAREHLAQADAVVFSHPWCFPPLADALRPDQLVVYDSHNVECVLKAALYRDLPQAAPLIERVVAAEYSLCRRANLVLACSDADVELLGKLLHVDPFKFRIVPNGAFAERFPDIGQAERMALRRTLDLPVSRAIAIFLGSLYGPNVDAARFIAKELARACPSVLFIIAGGVGEALAGIHAGENILVTGRVDDARRDELLLASDLALNPMAAGSGTNIKMFDYMAAGLPILSTEIGARGISTARDSLSGVFVDDLSAFPERCNHLTTIVLVDPTYSQAVRALVRQRYAWERISHELGQLLLTSRRLRESTQSRRARVAMMTTWNVTCGIGEHSSYLVEALQKAGAEVLILGNSLHGHAPIGLERDVRVANVRVWHWDTISWQSSINEERFKAAVHAAQPDLLIIQHHTGFAPFADVEQAVATTIENGIPVIVEMHNARDVPVEQKHALCQLGALLFVHQREEAAGLPPDDAANVRVMPLPVHRIETARKARTVRNGTIVIGGFGFLRPYKGLPVLIKALALLRPKYPGIRYSGLHAMYAGDDSAQHLQECLELARSLGLGEAIDIDTDFLPVDEIERRLSATEIVVLPYEPSNEGASSAANMALASGRPVVVSPSAIFKSTSHVTYVAPRHDAEAYAYAIDQLLSDPGLGADLIQRQTKWVEQHSYANAATLILHSQTSCTNTRNIHDARLRTNA